MYKLEYYTRQKEKWTSKEDQEIQTEYETENLTISQMGDIHKRTPGAVAFAIKRLGLITCNQNARGYPEYKRSALYAEIISTPRERSEKKEKTNEIDLEEQGEHQGEQWTDLEEQQLLNELEINMDHYSIAKNHGRTICAIRKRIRHIVYNLYIKGTSNESVCQLTKLSEEQILKIIKGNETSQETRKKLIQTKIQLKPILPLQTEFDIIKSEITELKTDIKTIKSEVLSLKKMLKHLTLLMESVYEFENQAE